MLKSIPGMRLAWRWNGIVTLVVAAVIAGGCSSVPRRVASPQPQLVSITMIRASFEGQQFAVELLLTNPNAVEIPVRLVEFDIRLGGEGLLRGVAAVPFTLPPGGQETLQVEVFSEIVSSVNRLMSMAQGPQNILDYELQGRVTMDVSMRDPLTIAHRGQVPLMVTAVSP